MRAFLTTLAAMMALLALRGFPVAGAEAEDWWSLRPVREPALPDVKDRSWSRHPIDRFVLARLEAAGLSPARRAGRQTLIRRLSFVLTGLPPAPADVDRFVNDASPAAYESLVDRLLRSPHFGEHWARHWMDVVRYSDTYGYEWDIPAKGAWRYRDYLIRAFNADVPFDQLVREQIAGDLLETPRINDREEINESLIGTMFFQLGEKRHGDSAEFNGIHQEMLDNKIDAFSKTFQAMTISCARCHDHKIDPVLQREYYALAGVFMSSRWLTHTVDAPERNATIMRRLRDVKPRLRGELATFWVEELRDRAAWRKVPEPAGDTKMSLEDPLHPWFRLSRSAREGRDIEADWRELAQEYSQQRRTRIKENARDFVVLADFHRGVPAGWSVDGVGLRDGVVECGDFTVALQGPAAIGRILPGGLYTNSLSPRLNGAVRTPYLDTLGKGTISIECCGGQFSAHRTVVDNAFLTERQRYLTGDDPGWQQFPAWPAEPRRKVYIELATKTSNPNFPPRVGLGGKCSEDEAADPQSWFGIRRVVRHHRATPPADELQRFEGLFHGDPPTDLEGVAERYTRWFLDALVAWSREAATEGDVELVNWMLDHDVLSNRHELPSRPAVARLVEEYRGLEKQLVDPQTVNGMADVDPGYDYRLNIRGDYNELGDPVPRGYIAVIPGVDRRVPAGVSRSGRRELAELIASRDNPLTARVHVNRVWHWVFGQGIVTTPSDFGRLGDEPSHPELLDFLASRFVQNGWSLKRLVRSLVLSETWRQSGRPSGGTSGRASAVDPTNRLLHHARLRRLQAESVRDVMLVVSGRLDRRRFGAPIDPHRMNEDPQKRLFSGPLDGEGRRSIYTKITVMEPPRFLATFNQPDPKIPTGRRDVSNTTTQSLALLNDPLVDAQAEFWAATIVAVGDATPGERIDRMFRRALARGPSTAERRRWVAAAADLASLHGVARGGELRSTAVWKDIAHALFNTKEFIYIR